MVVEVVAAVRTAFSWWTFRRTLLLRAAATAATALSSALHRLITSHRIVCIACCTQRPQSVQRFPV